MNVRKSWSGFPQRKGKATSAARIACNIQLGAMAFRNPLGKGKAQAGAGWGTRAGRRSAVEAIEYPEFMLGCDSYAGVMDRENNALPIDCGF
jgi:hypothetical protein